MLDRGSPRDRQHDGRSPQEPGECYLGGARTMRLRDSMQYFPGDPACAKRKPGDKSDSIVLAIIHYVVPFTVGKAISVLDRDDRHNFARPLDVLLRDIGQSDQANLSFVSQLGQSFHGRVEGHDGIRNVQLVNVDAVHAQPLKAALNRFAKVGGRRVMGPLIRARTVPASLGRNHKAGRVGKQRLGNQLFTYVWTVGIRSVDELDIKLDGAAKNG